MLAARGFSLIELMLVLVLLGIFAGCAVPWYGDYVRRGQRGAAVALLQENAIYLEEFFHQHGSYKLSPTRWPDLPKPSSPASGQIAYQLAFGSLPRNTDEGYYVLRASRVLPQSDGEVISLTQTGILKLCLTRDAVEKCELVH